MAGIYIHIPFCKQACNYCDFHFSTNLQTKEGFLSALYTELKLRSDELGKMEFDTIYFGGGTPSMLTKEELSRIFDEIFSNYQISSTAEITLEANPDDLSPGKIRELRSTPVNRFSIGVQSFFNQDLLYMNRAHKANEAESAVKGAQDAGFENISIDLIYGTPGLTPENWELNLRKSIELLVPHISAYALTVEENTPLFHLIKRNKLSNVDEELVADHYNIMVALLRQNGFEQYEISNFARAGAQSKHNSSYWYGKPYLGFGPSAHSFNGDNLRRWNVSNNVQYIKAVINNDIFYETESITFVNQVNEFLLTRLRLQEGFSLTEFEQRFGVSSKDTLLLNLQNQQNQHYVNANNTLVLTDSGKLISDRLISELFFNP